MTKISRNAPCHCGSGKKYKKCCLDQDREGGASRRTLSPVSPEASFDTIDNPLASRFASTSPYVVARIFEASEEFATIQRRDPDEARRFWIPGRMAALETEEIVTRLRKLGIDGRREAYLKLVGDRTSAWNLSESWRTKIHHRLSQHEKDFLGIAACELWKRYCPERPSVEMLDDWMQEGYQAAMNGQGAQACDRWWPVWEIIRSRLTAHMRTCDRAAVVFEGTQVVYNWVQDFQLELHNAALDQPRYADLGVRLCEEVLGQFSEEDELFRLNFRTDLGEFYYMAGRPEDGERVLLALIHDHPDRAAGYARLADILAYGIRPHQGPIDPQRAQTLLEAALARPVTDAEHYGLKDLLQDLRDSNVANPR